MTWRAGEREGESATPAGSLIISFCREALRPSPDFAPQGKATTNGHEWTQIRTTEIEEEDEDQKEHEVKPVCLPQMNADLEMAAKRRKRHKREIIRRWTQIGKNTDGEKDSQANCADEREKDFPKKFVIIREIRVTVCFYLRESASFCGLSSDL